MRLRGLAAGERYVMKFEQRLLGLVVFSLLLAGLGYALYRLQRVEMAERPVGTTVIAHLQGATSPPTTVPALSAWRYDDVADPVHGIRRKLACVAASGGAAGANTANPIPAQLCVRSSLQNGVDVYVRLLGEGSILCQPPGCAIKAQFGEQSVRSVRAVGAADGSTNIVFVSRRAGRAFVSSLKVARSTIVKVALDKSGERELAFDTAGLVWN
jgi:hypothetical protein